MAMENERSIVDETIALPEKWFFNVLGTLSPEVQYLVIQELERRELLDRLKWIPWIVLDHTADQELRNYVLGVIARLESISTRRALIDIPYAYVS
jgi:hypothetical protein